MTATGTASMLSDVEEERASRLRASEIGAVRPSRTHASSGLVLRVGRSLVDPER